MLQVVTCEYPPEKEKRKGKKEKEDRDKDEAKETVTKALHSRQFPLPNLFH